MYMYNSYQHTYMYTSPTGTNTNCEFTHTLIFFVTCLLSSLVGTNTTILTHCESPLTYKINNNTCNSK